MNIKEIHEKYKNCACGKEHNCPIDYVIIKNGAAGELPEISKEYNHILLVSDENTYRVCGESVYNLLSDKISKSIVLTPNGDVVIPNEEKIAEIESFITSETDLIIGVGSGVINDLCKHVSFKHGLGYYIVATAPSMDGYASVGAALILEGMKITLNARPPKAIIADTSVLKDAPLDMLRAGYGDIIGKYSCLNDWKLSALINNEYFCQAIYDMTFNEADRVKAIAKGITSRDENAVKILMEALVTVGVAMSFVGNSRPASGSEHHLSHFFEITGILENKEYYPHGIDVGFSSIVTAQIRENLLNQTPSRRKFNRDEWEKAIKEIYLSSADGVIALQDKLGWYGADDSAFITENWSQIRDILKESPTADEFKCMLSDIGLDFADFEKMYGREKINNAIKYAKDLKDRYSVLWLSHMYFS